MPRWGAAIVVVLAFYRGLTLSGCEPPTEEAAPAVPPVIAVGNLNNLYVLAPARAEGDEPGFRYAQRDAAGAWPESFRGSGYSVPVAAAAWREALVVFFPSGRWSRFGSVSPAVEESPAPAWKPAAACEDGLAVDVFGWSEAGDPIYIRLGEGEPRWQRMDAAIEAGKALDPAAVRHKGRLYLVWREQQPALAGAGAESRVHFAYRENETWQTAPSRLRVGSVPLVAAAGDDLVCLYRKPAGPSASPGGAAGPWTLATYATADEDWHEVGPLGGTIPDGALALARQGERLYVVAAADGGARIAALDVAACRAGEFVPVPLSPAADESEGDARLYAFLVMVALFVGMVLLMAKRLRAERQGVAAAPAADRAAASIAQRAAAVLVDYVLLGIFLTPVILYVGPDLPERLLRGETLPMDKVLLLELARIGLAVVYFTLAEGATGRTVGKALLGIEVRGVGGERATWKQALARNALRVVDEMPALYLVGLALVLIGPRPQRLGDRLARTLVVRSSKQGSAVG